MYIIHKLQYLLYVFIIVQIGEFSATVLSLLLDLFPSLLLKVGRYNNITVFSIFNFAIALQTFQKKFSTMESEQRSALERYSFHILKLFGVLSQGESTGPFRRYSWRVAVSYQYQ